MTHPPEVREALEEARKALRCMFIEVEASVAEDINAKVEAALDALQAEVERAWGEQALAAEVNERVEAERDALQAEVERLRIALTRQRRRLDEDYFAECRVSEKARDLARYLEVRLREAGLETGPILDAFEKDWESRRRVAESRGEER